MIWILECSKSGQITLPQELRKRLGLEPGGKVLLTDRSGRFELRSLGGSILDWYGAVSVDGSQDWKSIKRQVGEARAHEALRE